jgi:hypothetical protein
MKTFLTRFFVTLGVLFFLLLCAGAYLWFADPFELRPLVSMLMTPAASHSTPSADSNAASAETPSATDSTSPSAVQAEAKSSLSPEQVSALEKIGIDPATLPTTITPAQEACFTEKLGAPRVAEIKAGATPSAAEFFTARSCLQ